MRAAELKELESLADGVMARSAAFLERARDVAADHGVDLLDAACDAGGVWTLQLRLIPSQTLVEVAEPASLPAEEIDESGLLFVSPVRTSAPFVGDDSGDLRAMLEAADESVIVPPLPADPSRHLPWLSDDERLDLLAPAIVGDAMLSLQHLGLDTDETRYAAALADGRTLYRSEVERLTGSGDVSARLHHYDQVASTAPRFLQAGE